MWNGTDHLLLVYPYNDEDYETLLDNELHELWAYLEELLKHSLRTVIMLIGLVVEGLVIGT